MNARDERVARVASALRNAGVRSEIKRLSENTATAPLAAAALGCEVSRIAKTLVFRREHDDAAVVAILSGAKRVCVAKLSAVAGGKIRKADADFVRDRCGFEIGGMSPVGIASAEVVAMDSGLKQFATVWAAAGSAHAVFEVAPDDLARASGAVVSDIAEESSGSSPA